MNGLENKQFYEEKARTCKVVELDTNKAQSQYTTARGLNFKIVGHLFQAAAQHVSVLGLFHFVYRDAILLCRFPRIIIWLSPWSAQRVP